MKEKVKIWSRRRLLGAFLAFLGLAAVATAQNGTRKANCGSELAVVTKTVNQLNDDNGTSITLNFTGMVNAGDEYFFVADNGGGALSSINCNNNIGKNIAIIDDGYTEGDYIDLSESTTDENSVPSRAAGVFTATDGNINPITITLKYSDGSDGIASNNTTLYLGVFVKEASTGCYSDVNWIRIETELNIYAALTLRNAGTVGTPDYVPYEYICNAGTTGTNLGFTLCNLPADGTLKYKVKATSSQVSESYIISGQLLNASAGTVAESGTLANTGVATNVITKSITRGTDAPYTALVEIGNQTLINANAAVAGTMVFSFVEMTYTYRGEIRPGVQGDITLPIVFETEQSNCNPSINATYPTEFTVHVAPAFTITPLQYADDARTRQVTDGFCQGTIAYLNTTTSATEGKITDWVWTVDAASANADEAKAKFFPAFSTSDPIQAAITGGTTLVENTAKVGELTSIVANVYKYDLVATWNDADNHYTGCIANADIDIVVNAAPILLLATDQAEVDGIQTWNATNKITYTGAICPGELIKIETDDVATILATNDDNDPQTVDGNTVDPRYNYMVAGDYIKANGATLKYTVSPNEVDPAVGAYTTWRTDLAPATANLNVAHYLNNGTAAQANIIYTVENSDPNGCKLVKSNGSSLNLEAEKDGKVQIIFPVQPRPKFNLSAN